jgi:hypothetical protein
MDPRTLTLKFGPQNQYALTMPIALAVNAELVIAADDTLYAANLQEHIDTCPQQKQFEWMQVNEQQEETENAAV